MLVRSQENYQSHGETANGGTRFNENKKCCLGHPDHDLLLRFPKFDWTDKKHFSDFFAPIVQATPLKVTLPVTVTRNL